MTAVCLFGCFLAVYADNITAPTDNTTTIVTSCTTLTTSKNGRVHGWVPQPNSRGTIDILWTCLFTIFVCTYTMLCLNLPAVNDPLYRRIGRKLFWMGVSIAGPEFVLTAASGQWNAARESVELFRAAGYTDDQWTIRHGFFADMGGFLLVPAPNSPNTIENRPFPITSKHLLWLVKKGYTDFPEVTVEDLDDKSKQDTIAKVITSIQVGYLILQSIGRAIQRLAVTTLELSALAIVVCSILTNLCWLRKPLDVRTPIKVQLKTTMGVIRQDARGSEKEAEKEWKQTPLDFIDDMRPSWNFNVQEFAGMPLPPYERPVPRIGNDRIPSLKWDQKIFLCIATLVYAAIHLAGWNFSFPTHVELILWRVSSSFLFGTTFLFWIFETMASLHRKGWWQEFFYRVFKPSRLEGVKKARQEKDATRQEKVAKGEIEPKELPLPAEFWSILPLAILYGAARFYIVVEVFFGLRSLEPSAYLNVNWSSFIPHV
ncbi:hypothetical protein K440DRAFT_565110 [Wilcoxina mikolae CBS 423.85]|nr:hypothetical protein K440DRAFT_565110 [Wilcoxina mikolae CBS 423.85]